MKAHHVAAVGAMILMCIVLVILFVQQATMDPGEAARKKLKASDTSDLARKRHPEMPKFIPYRDRLKDAAGDISSRQARNELLKQLTHEAALQNEAILRFRSNASFESFLATADALGVRIKGAIPRLRALRVGFDDVDQLVQALEGLDNDDLSLGPNYLVQIPEIPEANPETTVQPLIPFRDNVLDWLGVTTSNANWGEGIVVAVIDTGIADHPAFRADQIGLTALDGVVTQGDSLGHGTAVASLIAGNGAGVTGVAPGASLLSYPIVNADGVSDSFTLANAIFDAVDSGADIINISLGSSADSPLVRDAVQFALANDRIVVAAAGNEGVQAVSYPAAYDGVIGVAAIDASGQHVYFSNTGEGVTIAAPGIGITSAWGTDAFIEFSGTSASTPLVSGLLARELSTGSSFAKAIDDVLSNANEAGPPGDDLFHGKGNLNIGRLINKNTPGIYDVAVASQTFENPYVTATTSHRTLLPVVENRGTETLYNVNLSVTAGSNVRDFSIPILKVGEISVHQFPVSTAEARSDGALQVVSRVTSNVKDQNTGDNQLRSIIVINPDS